MMNYAAGGLHNTAYYLKGKGRGRDTELVHMTPKEVKGLQAMAKAHGGSLTINPTTGLPEAGFLEDILPVVAAAGLTYLTAGAATPLLTGALGATGAGIVAGAGAGAAISGGMAAIQGKNVGQAALMGGLGGGISGGLGAYADANVFGVGTPTPTVAPDGSTILSSTAPTTAPTYGPMGDIVPTAPPLPTSFPTVNPAGNALSIPDPSVPGGFISSETGTRLMTSPSVNAAPTEFTLTDPFLGSVPTYPSVPVDPAGVTPKAGTLDLVGESYAVPRSPTAMYAGTEQGLVTPSVLPQTPTPPPSYYGGLGSGAMDTAKKAAIQGLPAVAGAMGSETYDQQQVGPQDPYNSRLRRISPDFRAYEPPRPNPYYRAQYAAEGGVMQAGGAMDDEMGGDYSAMGMDQGNMQKGLFGKGYAPGGPTKLPKGDPGIYRDADPTTRGQDAFTAALTRLNSLQKRANIKGLPALKAAAAPLSDIQEAAKGGVMSSLGGYSDGGRMLRGPGDGMSDSIPGVIGNKQPARLADGEFVVPADVVSHLGNGSTDAGARKLYAMMDNIRKARTGKKKQAPAVKTSRYMPA